MSQYYPPECGSKSFHCLYCHVYAEQVWYDILHHGGIEVSIRNGYLRASYCSHCKTPTIWLDEKTIYPNTGEFPRPNSDLPDDVKKIYDEAGAIAQQSPRAASALLRLAIEMLLNHLGEKGSINVGIRNLVQKKMLDPQIEQAFDIVRVTGNNAVHPGQIVFDDITDVHPLFEMINIIAEALITRPKRIQGLYNSLPGKKKGKR